MISSAATSLMRAIAASLAIANRFTGTSFIFHNAGGYAHCSREIGMIFRRRAEAHWCVSEVILLDFGRERAEVAASGIKISSTSMAATTFFADDMNMAYRSA